MKRAVAFILCLLSSCSDRLTGGKIIGKRTEYWGSMHYYITVKDKDRTGEVEVTEQVWNKATSDMVWPFDSTK